jgi:hypothetical protein
VTLDGCVETDKGVPDYLPVLRFGLAAALVAFSSTTRTVAGFAVLHALEPDHNVVKFLTTLLQLSPQFIVAPLRERTTALRSRVGQHLTERLQALAHFAQRHNGGSVIAFGLSSRQQLPCLPPYTLRFREKIHTMLFFLPLGGLHDGAGDVVFVA